MGSPAIGGVVLVEFPYSNYLKFKKRPALVIGSAEFGNLIICQITSRKFPSTSIINLSDADFINGGLQVDSFIRPDKIHTIDIALVQGQIGEISDQKVSQVKQKLAQILELNKTS